MHTLVDPAAMMVRARAVVRFRRSPSMVLRLTSSVLPVALAAMMAPGMGLRGAQTPAAGPTRFPANGANDVSPDTHLVLTFRRAPALGSAGRIRVFDANTGVVVDTIDLAAPEQRTVIGGFPEGFRFLPVTVRGTTATIALHHNVLAHGRSYVVQVEPGVLVAEGFGGIMGWQFRTRAAPPSLAAGRLTVAADGSGDFNTVQGAVDFVPATPQRPVTIFVKNGRYEEIVYFRQKHDITFTGETRDGVVISYPNNERFNGPPTGVATNERPGTFPYRRAVFHADRSTDIQILNLTIENTTPAGGGQAEALLLSGGRNLVSHATLISHQDTVQFNDSVYVEDSLIVGDTDFLWGRGPAFFRNVTMRQQSSGPFMWVRSTSASHGFVFDHCTFDTAAPPGGALPYLARNTAAYPDSEVVLLEATLGAIHPAAWMLPAEAARMKYWEFASRDRAGQPADVRERHPVSRQLNPTRDADTIASYRNAPFVLGGWTPVLDSAGR